MISRRERAQRLISVIRDRAFAELERERGELAPMALTMDAAGRIGMIAVYTGDTYPDPDNQLADLQATLKKQVALHRLDAAATAHHAMPQTLDANRSHLAHLTPHDMTEL